MTDTTGNATSDGSTAGISIIPRPISLERTGEGYRLTAPVIIRAGEDVATAVGLLGERLGGTADARDGEAAQVTITLDAALGAEAYELNSGPDGVTITGGDAAGAFYGAMTLLQLLPPAVFSNDPGTGWEVPGVRISDRPAFAWRGSHLDCARHFMPLDFVLKYIDLLALHKLNVFHWHLTEDQGWRLQIDKYPRLTEVGAWRRETVLYRPDKFHPENDRYDKTPHGGFYSKDDVRTVLAHAHKRHVRVVPEIELPGHAQAAIAAYPELGNTGEQIEVGRKWGVIYDVLNVEDSTIRFFQDVFDEVIELFDSPYIHVGGDECPKDQWQASARAQERMEELDLPDEEHLQSWFIRQFDDHLNARGRTLVGWDEILEGGLAEKAVVMSWRGEEGGIAAARAGHDVVMAPMTHTYFDFYQSNDRVQHTYSIGGYTPLSHVYTYRPIPAELTEEEAKHVLGAQYQVWTEYMPTPGHVELMAFPRACALAECVWHPEPGVYEEFFGRLQVHAKRLDALEVSYYPLGLAE
ncbi:MAG TPA: beta-N-acetylhexosaminidase [Thermomicrobiales bacterium]|nr:beta-N-acetylhexosaminidase [Thermomicrobiales bacterium]